MNTAVIQRQYDEVIADHYDVDPLAVTRNALARALDHVQRTCPLRADLPPLAVLDVGMGTGLFLEQLRNQSAREIEPYGIDLSARMVEIAQAKLPDLQAVVADASSLADVFGDRQFDLVCTHFITGFVPLIHLAPQIYNRLKPGACWSFVGGTSAAYPELQRTAKSLPLRIVMRGRRLDLSGLLTPADAASVVRVFAANDLETCGVETFEPELHFRDFDGFMEFAYQGGWLTPFIEALGLHKARPYLRRLFNALVFPMTDRHKIAIGLARRPVA